MTTTAVKALDAKKRAAEARALGAATTGYQVRAQRSGGVGGLVVPEGAARSTGGFPTAFREPKKVDYNGQQMWNLGGVASVYELRYEMWDMFGPYDELVRKGAGDKTLAADPDVVFLTNHRGLLMARTVAAAGKLPTLTLDTVEVEEYGTLGLGMETWLNPKRTDVADLMHAIGEGILTEMSFAFMITQGWWSDDWLTFEIVEYDINRGDVSAVNYGANPYTSIAARQSELVQTMRDMPASAARAALATLMNRDDVDLDTLFRAYQLGHDRDTAAARGHGPDDGLSDLARPATPVTAPVSPAPAQRGATMSVLHAEALLTEVD